MSEQSMVSADLLSSMHPDDRLDFHLAGSFLSSIVLEDLKDIYAATKSAEEDDALMRQDIRWLLGNEDDPDRYVQTYTWYDKQTRYIAGKLVGYDFDQRDEIVDRYKKQLKDDYSYGTA